MHAIALALVPYLDALGQRALPDGGFAPDAARRRSPRTDATAWAVLALRASGVGDESLAPARSWLAAQQLADGRVSVTPEHPAAAWPTPLAILAWQGSVDHREAETRAVTFLLEFGGLALPRTPVLGHDTTLVGWPWIEATHSWVEPTALGLMALRVTAHREHPRAQEARALLLDRRLAQGGWNYGNTTAFGQELRPSPESTGLALTALADDASPEVGSLFESSLDYLDREASRIRSPLSLAWALIGLGAWQRLPPAAVEWSVECLERQEVLGSYDTALLALVLLAAQVPSGLVRSLSEV